MNAHALLSAQGWRGHGHSLHKTDDTIGLAKPLLLSRKDNTKGLGTSQHFNADQWWLNAFDEQLKGLETSKDGGVRQTVTTGKLNTVEMGSMGKYSVYTSFVSGGFLEGTVDLLKKLSATSISDSTPEDDQDAKKAKLKSSKKSKETKEERRARKDAKRRRKEERALRRAARQARRERKKAKALGKASSSSGSSDAAKEEKRRRRAKKEERRRKRKAEDKP
ncbi:hypothetical protein ACO1O0_003314 [Amphichorda felina]